MMFLVALQTQMLFVDAFLQNNRLDHVTQLMGYHPNYLEMFLRTQQYLLRGDGPLPFHYRHYIAIMVSHITTDPNIYITLSNSLFLATLEKALVMQIKT